MLNKSTLLFSIFFLILVSQLSPAQPASEKILDNIKIFPDVVYAHKYGMALTMDIYRPENSNGAAVLFINSGGFHSPWMPSQFRTENRAEQNPYNAGNTFIRKDKIIKHKFLRQFSFENLLLSGFTVYDIKHGSSPKFKLDEIVNDCSIALDYVKYTSDYYNIDTNRIGIWGPSAGGYLAGYLGFRVLSGNNSPAAALCLYYPTGFDFTKFPELNKKVPAMQIGDSTLAALSLNNFISPASPPTLIIYGSDESDFITGPSEEINNRLIKSGVECRLIVLENTTHILADKDGKYNAENVVKATSEMVKWFKEHLTSE